MQGKQDALTPLPSAPAPCCRGNRRAIPGKALEFSGQRRVVRAGQTHPTPPGPAPTSPERPSSTMLPSISRPLGNTLNRIATMPDLRIGGLTSSGINGSHVRSVSRCQRCSQALKSTPCVSESTSMPARPRARMHRQPAGGQIARRLYPDCATRPSWRRATGRQDSASPWQSWAARAQPPGAALPPAPAGCGGMGCEGDGCTVGGAAGAGAGSGAGAVFPVHRLQRLLVDLRRLLRHRLDRHLGLHCAQRVRRQVKVLQVLVLS